MARNCENPFSTSNSKPTVDTMIKKPNTILVLSAGSLVGFNIVQAIGNRRESLSLMATNSKSTEPSLSLFDEVHLVPQTTTDEVQFIHIVENWLDSTNIKLVIPCRDDDVVALAKLYNKRPDLGDRLLVGSFHIASAMLDKWESWILSSEHELPFVATMLPTDHATIDEFAQHWGFPFIAKPRNGFASHGVSIIMNHKQLTALVGRTDLVVQHYLGDKEEVFRFISKSDMSGIPLFYTFEEDKTSIQVMISPDGIPTAVFATINTMKNGISTSVVKDDSTDSLELGHTCGQILGRLGWRGPLNIQCQRRADGELAIYEFNGRFTGATAARTLLGFDEVGMALELFANQKIEMAPINDSMKVIRQPYSVPINNDIAFILNQSGYWKKGPSA